MSQLLEEYEQKQIRGERQQGVCYGHKQNEIVLGDAITITGGNIDS
jgi:hypothetical protein